MNHNPIFMALLPGGMIDLPRLGLRKIFSYVPPLIGDAWNVPRRKDQLAFFFFLILAFKIALFIINAQTSISQLLCHFQSIPQRI